MSRERENFDTQTCISLVRDREPGEGREGQVFQNCVAEKSHPRCCHRLV